MYSFSTEWLYNSNNPWIKSYIHSGLFQADDGLFPVCDAVLRLWALATSQPQGLKTEQPACVCD